MDINIQESPNENIKRNTFRTGKETEFGSRQNCVLGDKGWYGDQNCKECHNTQRRSNR